MNLKNTLKLEQLAMMLTALFLGIYLLEFKWWWYLIFILAPDISMLGYAIGTRVGAFFYNLFHHKGTAFLIFLLGYYLNEQYLINNQYLMFAGIIILAHSSMDRIFGYGLKYDDDFKHTHLGMIGNKT
ncbi:MAG: DUF4260 domain-containing protein [Bacteroidetes bacterium]|nr:DUF4260 domain-containing protein [Bacteroidota bacterium]